MLSFFKCMRCFSMYNLFSRHNFFVRRLSRTRHTIFLLLYTRYRLWDPRVRFFFTLCCHRRPPSSLPFSFFFQRLLPAPFRRPPLPCALSAADPRASSGQRRSSCARSRARGARVRQDREESDLNISWCIQVTCHAMSRWIFIQVNNQQAAMENKDIKR